MERYFPPGRTDLVLFALEHIFHQELLDKMLRDRGKGLSFKKWHNLLHVMRETYELFSRESMQTGRTDPQDIRNDKSTIFQEIRF